MLEQHTCSLLLQNIYSCHLVSVNRNVHAPAFEMTSYDASISEAFTLGGEVVRLCASDADDDVITFSIEGEFASSFSSTLRT